MRILQVHERYQQRGGEDVEADAEMRLLRDNGHIVLEYSRHNSEIAEYGAWRKAMLGIRTVWASDSYREVSFLVETERPDVVHFHNTFPLVSPACYYACRHAGVPVVQTVQNYRLLCPAATFYRDGRICQDCLGKKLAWPGVLHACYRSSRPATAAIAAMLGVHNAMRTWQNQVDAFIAVTEFARRKLVEGGLPAAKIVVKPNLVYPDPREELRRSPADSRALEASRYALFVGRLAPEKGVRTLVAAWNRLGCGAPLRVVGDGPLRAELERAADSSKRISFAGFQERKEILAALAGCRFLIFPSEWYETFGIVAVEAFACGVPVIASRLGAMEEVVSDGRTGLHFNAGDSEDLARTVEWAWTHPEEMSAMGRAARTEYETRYSAERNARALIGLYETLSRSHDGADRRAAG